MIPAQRRALLLDYIKKHGAASIQELSGHVGCSESTARRDLDYLHGQGYLVRSYGGANLLALPSTTFEPDIEIGSHQNLEAKRAIGAIAARRVRDGWSVAFDSSSTVLEAAKEVMRLGLHLTVVTNDLSIASLFVHAPQVNVVVSGGSLRHRSYTLLGEPGSEFLDRVHVDVAFIGVHAIGDGVLSDTSIDVVTTKRRFIKAARQVIVVADATKFGFPAFLEITTLDHVDELITDSRISPEDLARARSHVATITIAELPSEAKEGEQT